VNIKCTNVKGLNTNTSKLLRYCDQGASIIITSHGKPRAILHQMTEDDLEDFFLERMVQERLKKDDKKKLVALDGVMKNLGLQDED